MSTFDLKKIAEDAAYRDGLRHRCLSDLFFLAETLGFKNFHRELHRPVVEQLYFAKNPLLPIEDQHHKKKRLHLDPRGTFKTTMGRVEKLQWLLAFPDTITILNESATQPLARAISKGIAGYFWNNGRPTALQAMWPELVVDREPFKGASEDKWNSPKRYGDPSDLDSTLAYTSPRSVQSGWHPFVINADDMVETENSGLDANPDVRRSVINTYDTNANTLRAGGYIYLIGTRYHPFDLYGVKLETLDPDEWELLIRASVVVKSGKPLVPGEFPEEDEVEMCFGVLPGMDYRTMRAKFHENYEAFMCQQQNSPMGGNVPTFDEAMYTACEIPPEKIPLQREGEVFICWRPSFRDNRYAEGAVARIEDGKVTVVDCWRGNWTPSGFAERVVQMQKKYQADGVILIEVPGSQHLGYEIRNEAARKNVSLKLQWVWWNESDDLRVAEVKKLEPMLKTGRIRFSTAMTRRADCRTQFIHYGLVEENGIIEAVSKLADRVPMSVLRSNMEDDELEIQRRRREDAMFHLHINVEGIEQVNEQIAQRTMAHEKAMQAATTWGLPPMPGGLDG